MNTQNAGTLRDVVKEETGCVDGKEGTFSKYLFQFGTKREIMHDFSGVVVEVSRMERFVILGRIIYNRVTFEKMSHCELRNCMFK